MLLVFGLFVIPFIWMAPIAAQAATYYVAKTGSNNHSCSQAQSESTPKLTVAAGVACMGGVGGHTLIIKAGTYAEGFDQDSGGIVLPSGPSSSQPTTIKRDGTDTVTFACPGNRVNGEQQCIYLIGKSNITFDGLSMDCSMAVGNCFYTNGSSNIAFKNGRLFGATKNVPVANQGGGAQNRNIQVVNSEITAANKGQRQHGFYLSRCDNCLVEGNWVHGHGRTGIQIFYQTATHIMQGGIVRNNLFENNDGRCAFISVAVNVEFYGNICRHNGNPTESRATVLAGTHSISTGHKIYNNTIYDNTVQNGSVNACISVDSGTATVRNNLCLSNKPNNKVGRNGGTITESNNLSSTDITLVEDAGNGRFNPRSGSVLINAGTLSGLPSGLRFVGSAPDQGAMEFSESAPPPQSANIPDAPISLRVVAD
jgi:hypothetical protein